jgi:serine/threonine-protein kinase RsbW
VPLSIKIELGLPRDVATIPLVRHVLKHTLTEYGVEAGCLGDVSLAISEACANVVEHTAGEDEYEVTIAVVDDLCEIRVIDVGTGFDYLSLGDSSSNSQLAERGRGIAIMHAVTDHVAFESVPEKGTVVHLTKRLEFASSPLDRKPHM